MKTVLAFAAVAIAFLVAPRATDAQAATFKATLTWVDNSDNEDGFKIERCTGNGCNDFAQIDQVGAGVTTYSNTGLEANTRYGYRVRAFNAAGNSGYSNIARRRTLH